MLCQSFFVFWICAISFAFADENPAQCQELAKCMQKTNDLMLNCFNLVKAIDVSKIQQSEKEFSQCSQMIKDGQLRYIKAQDLISNAYVKCLTGTKPLANFSCENDYFKNEINTPQRFRRGDILDVAYDQAEKAQKCIDKAEEKWETCSETYSESCGDRKGLCDLCYELSKSHDEQHKAGLDGWMGYIICDSKAPKEDQSER